MRASEAIRVSLSKVERVSKMIKSLCDLLVVAVGVVWIVLLGFAIAGGFSGEGESPFSVNLGTLVYLSVILALVAAFLIVVSRIFAAVVEGESPFRKKQVKRIRLLAYLMIAKAFIEALFSAGNALIMQIGEWDIMCIDTGFLGDQTIFFIDAGALFMAVVIICLSVVFEYGTLLQRLSDEAA